MIGAQKLRPFLLVCQGAKSLKSKIDVVVGGHLTVDLVPGGKIAGWHCILCRANLCCARTSRRHPHQRRL